MSDVTYPAELAIHPLGGAVNATVHVPGSKSITNRALVLAALASTQQACTLTGALRSEDTEVMVQCLDQLGFGIDADWDTETITIARNRTPYVIPASTADLFVGNSGTTIRFLTAMLALGHGSYRLDGIPRMRERPIGDLLEALRQLGIDATSDQGNGCPPVIVQSQGLPGGDVSIKANISSQYLSGLLLVAPFAKDTITLRISGELVSEPYVAMTVTMLRQFGLEVQTPEPGVFVVPGQQQVTIAEYAIEPDASAASYFWALAAITGGRVTVAELSRQSLQGDVHFVNVLEQMGCRIEECDTGITVHGRPLHGVDIDMNAISDTVMTLAAVALFADGPTHIRNVAHIRHKETDRIAALATELRKLGAEVTERPDGLSIHPRVLSGCPLETYNDHRMAMSLALVGLGVPGVVIRHPACVAKTYPRYWQDLEAATR